MQLRALYATGSSCTSSVQKLADNMRARLEIADMLAPAYFAKRTTNMTCMRSMLYVLWYWTSSSHAHTKRLDPARITYRSSRCGSFPPCSRQNCPVHIEGYSTHDPLPQERLHTAKTTPSTALVLTLMSWPPIISIRENSRLEWFTSRCTTPWDVNHW